MPLPPQLSRRLAAARDILAVLVFCAAVFFGGRAFINSPWLQKERVTQKEAEADIAAFFSQVRKSHPQPFARLSERKFELLRSSASAQAGARLDEFGRVTVRDLAFILYRAAAALGDPETRLLWQPLRKYRDPALKFPPFAAEYREGRFYAARCVDPALLGAELLEVNGVQFEKFVAPALERVSAETPRRRAWLFCRDQAFWWDFADLIPAEKPVAVKARLPNGRIAAKTLPPLPAGEFRRLAARVTPLPKMVYSQSRLGWLRAADLRDSRAARKLYAGFFAELEEKGADLLVLDLREAADGDRRGADELLGYMGGWLKGPMKKFSGRTFLLTGPGTGPAAAYFAARFRGLQAGEILGEDTGGTPGYFGAPETFTLPASGLKYSVASRHFPYPGAAPGGVAPDFVLSAEALKPCKGDLKSFILTRAGRRK